MMIATNDGTNDDKCGDDGADDFCATFDGDDGFAMQHHCAATMKLQQPSTKTAHN